MIRPTLRCLLLAVVLIPVSLLPALFGERLWSVWVAGIGVGVLLLGLDAVSILSRRRLEIETTPPPRLYIGDTDPLRLALAAPLSLRATEIEVLPAVSALLRPPDAVRVLVPAGGRGEVEIPLTPVRRGTARVESLWLRWSGPFGLVRRTVEHRTDLEVPVTPNVRAVRAAAIRFFRSREFLTGLKAERYVGDGSEFDSLREYQVGFDHRAMDWKASARHRRLLVREYRAERNHQIVLAYDTGHLMSEPMEGIPRLDHAINAGLILTFAALKTGDRVGFFAFDARVRSFSAPCGGIGRMPRHQALAAELEYTTAETNFTLGLMSLASRLSRRTLVVLFTDFVDTVTVELMLENVERLVARHLVICVTLRDPDLTALAEAPPEDLEALNRAVVATSFRREREVVLRRLRRLGVHTIDVPAREVSPRLIDRYLEIKRRELV